MTKELHKQYRPTDFSEMVGNESAIKLLEKKLESGNFPHALLLCGPTGSGKTTLSRILRKKLDVDKQDFIEMNASNDRGIETIRNLISNCRMSSLRGGNKIYLLDEVHQLTKAAQEALLKMLEDTPKHVYFILATTDPQNLSKALLSRLTTLKMEALRPKQVIQLVTEIAECEKQKLSVKVAEEISRLSEGLPREAVKLLDAVLGLKEEEALKALSTVKTSESNIKDLAKELMGSANWKELQGMLSDLLVDPESTRLALLGYLAAWAARDSSTHLIAVMSCFVDNYYSSGKAGLIIDVWNAHLVTKKIRGAK